MADTQADRQMEGGQAKGARRRPGWILLAGGAALLVGVGWLAVPRAAPGLAHPRSTVSQRGREFIPGYLDIRQGEVVRIVNDDEDLSHHAYVASSRFTFDSGDQEPGHDVDIPFTAAGTFNVLCGIHPKMKLVVNVR